jgi:protein subunit release factor A
MSIGVETVVVEIRAAEGGADARLLVGEQLAIYANLAEQRGL